MSAEVVRGFLDALQARDWSTASDRLAPDVVVTWPATGEVFHGAEFLAVQRAYPEGWQITVDNLFEDGSVVAAFVTVEHSGDRFQCAGRYKVEGERITAGVELWVTENGDEPPTWRR